MINILCISLQRVLMYLDSHHMLLVRTCLRKKIIYIYIFLFFSCRSALLYFVNIRTSFEPLYIFILFLYAGISAKPTFKHIPKVCHYIFTLAFYDGHLALNVCIAVFLYFVLRRLIRVYMGMYNTYKLLNRSILKSNSWLLH